MKTKVAIPIILLLLSVVLVQAGITNTTKDWEMFIGQISPDFKINGSTNVTINGSSTRIIQYNNTYIQQYYTYSDVLQKSLTAVRVQIVCEKDLSEYNNMHQNNTINKVTFYSKLYNHLTANPGTPVYVIEGDYAEITKAGIYNYVYILRNDNAIYLNLLFDNDNAYPDYYSQPCSMTIYNPSEVGDSLDVSGKTMKELEAEASIQVSNYIQLLTSSITNMINMLYEAVLIIYWVIKILLVIAVISSIFWLAMWFYNLIKSLLRRI